MSAFSQMILDPTEAPIKAADLDWTVSKQPLLKRDPTTGQLNLLPKHDALVRDDTGETISIVSKRYEPVQNYQTVEFFEQYSHHAKGAITHGGHWDNKHLALFAKLPMTTSPFGTEQEQQFYLMARSGHVPGHSLQIILTALTVVCTNQFSFCDTTQKGFFYQWHNTVFDRHAQTNAAGVLNAARNFIETYRQELQFLSTRTLTHTSGFLDNLFPTPLGKSQPRIVDQIQQNYINNTWIGATNETAKTRYALWNCITEAIDHTARGYGKSALIGKGQSIKHKAFNALLTA